MNQPSKRSTVKELALVEAEENPSLPTNDRVFEDCEVTLNSDELDEENYQYLKASVETSVEIIDLKQRQESEAA